MALYDSQAAKAACLQGTQGGSGREDSHRFCTAASITSSFFVKPLQASPSSVQMFGNPGDGIKNEVAKRKTDGQEVVPASVLGRLQGTRLGSLQ